MDSIDKATILNSLNNSNADRLQRIVDRKTAEEKQTPPTVYVGESDDGRSLVKPLGGAVTSLRTVGNVQASAGAPVRAAAGSADAGTNLRSYSSRPRERSGQVKVFFSIKRENSNIIEYWLGGDRSSPLKIMEVDTTQFTTVVAHGVATGTTKKDWIFTIQTHPAGVTDAPWSIQVFSGNNERKWQKTDTRAKYVDWRGLDFWQTYEISAATSEDVVYTINRFPTATELKVVETSNSTRIYDPGRTYFNSVWNLPISGSRSFIKTRIYRDPALEFFLAKYQSIDYTRTDQQTIYSTIWSLFSLNQALQEKSFSWTETQNVSESYFEESKAVVGGFDFSSTEVNATISDSTQAVYEIYVAPNTKKNSSVDITQNGNLYSFSDGIDRNNSIYIPFPQKNFNSQKIEPYYCFVDGYMYSKGTGAITDYYVNIKGVETKLVFPSTGINLISNNKKRNCWTVLGTKLQINIAPNLGDQLPAGSTVEFIPHVFVGSNFVDQTPFEKKLLPINVGQTANDEVKLISVQLWGDKD